jgi:hypothetical protein
MSMTGRIGSYYWAEVPNGRAAVRDVVRGMASRLRGLSGINVSWDSGKMQELGVVPAGWSVRGKHVVSPPIDDAMLSAWPQSGCNSGRYDEWYFFHVVPDKLELHALCNWGGVSLARSSELAFPGGFDLAAQLAAAQPEVVVGEGSALFVIATDEATVRQLLSVGAEA